MVAQGRKTFEGVWIAATFARSAKVTRKTGSKEWKKGQKWFEVRKNMWIYWGKFHKAWGWKKKQPHTSLFTKPPQALLIYLPHSGPLMVPLLIVYRAIHKRGSCWALCGNRPQEMAGWILLQLTKRHSRRQVANQSGLVGGWTPHRKNIFVKFQNFSR